MHTILDERDKLEITDRIGSISNNLFRVTKTGKSIVAEDSARYIPKGLRVFGGSKQKTTTGVQLLVLPDVDEFTLNGVKFSCKGGVITAKGTTTSVANIGHMITMLITGWIGTFVTSGEGTLKMYVSITNASGETRYINAGKPFTLDGTEEKVNVYFSIQSAEVTVDETIYPMLNAGSTVLPWEPYTGGIPAPNPEYPQEIINAILEEVGVYKRNLFNPDGEGYMSNITGEITSTTGKAVFAMSEYLPVSNVMTTIIKDYDSNNDRNYAYRVAWYDSNKNWIENHTLKQSKTKLGAPKNAKYFRASEGYKDTLMICYGDVDEYEPCTKQSLMISTPNGLPGIPVTDASLATYTDENGKMWCADEVDFERGVYVKRVVKLVPNSDWGSITHYQTNLTAENGFVSLRISQDRIPEVLSAFTSAKSVLMSNMFNAIGLWNSAKEHMTYTDGIMITTHYSNIGLSDWTDDRTKIATAFRQSDMYKELCIYALLKTPIETPLSAEELAQYKALTMNYPTTTILNNANAHMEVEYVANTQNHIEQNYLSKSEFETLKTRISSIEKSIL